MTHTVLAETRDPREKLLTQLRDLVPSAFLDGEPAREGLLDALGLEGDAKPSFVFASPGIERARRDARVLITATLVPEKDAR